MKSDNRNDNAMTQMTSGSQYIRDINATDVEIIAALGIPLSGEFEIYAMIAHAELLRNNVERRPPFFALAYSFVLLHVITEELAHITRTQAQAHGWNLTYEEVMDVVGRVYLRLRKLRNYGGKLKFNIEIIVRDILSRGEPK